MKNWNIVRIIRLLIGAIIIGYSLYENDNILIFLGLILMLQSIFNFSCCNSGTSCCGGADKDKKKLENLYADQIEKYSDK